MKFEPVCYDHAASLIDKRPWDVSRDQDLLVAAQQAAMNTYHYDVSVVGLDIYNVEIEAYGCPILDSGDNGVPAAGDPIFTDPDDLLALELAPAKHGRIPMILDAARQIAEQNPDAEVHIPMSGPFTIACHLLGMENAICNLAMEPDRMTAALEQLAANQQKFARLADSKGFGISLFESSVTPPLLSPAMFGKVVAPALRQILEGLNRPTQLIIGGDTIHILEDLLNLQPNYIICPVETDQVKFLSRVPAGPTVRVNMAPAVFQAGRMNDSLQEAERVFRLASTHSNTTVGSLIPYDADPEVVSRTADWVRDAT